MNNYRIPEAVKKYTEYDMIQTNTELPQFPESRARLLFAFLRKSSQASEQSELYVLVTGLAQLALDTHDMVGEAEAPLEKRHMRSRQLQVLAGDYFSSRFYHLLAEAGQIDLTKQLSAAICEANQIKMNLYHAMQQLKMNADDYIHELVRSRIQLFLIFGRWMDEKQRQVWPDLLQRLTVCEVIAEEIEKSETDKPDRDSWAFWHIMEKGTREEQKHVQSRETDLGKIRSILLKHQIKLQLFQRLEQQVSTIQELIRRFDPERRMHELTGLLEPFHRYLATPQVIEEI
jgi:heptaprenyl diphosphate synthase